MHLFVIIISQMLSVCHPCIAPAVDTATPHEQKCEHTTHHLLQHIATYPSGDNHRSRSCSPYSLRSLTRATSSIILQETTIVPGPAAHIPLRSSTRGTCSIMWFYTSGNSQSSEECLYSSDGCDSFSPSQHCRGKSQAAQSFAGCILNPCQVVEWKVHKHTQHTAELCSCLRPPTN